VSAVDEPATPARPLWVTRALWLVGGTALYNAVEAGVAVYAGLRAGSIALLGFGFDSVIELAAASVLWWRMSVQAAGATPERVARAEDRVRRFVGATFLLLALYVTVQSTWTLWVRDAPAESLLGILLALVSLTLMPLIALGKFRAAREIGSAALKAEAKETLACSYLSLCLLLGLVANAVAGWWWADPVAALLMVPWLIHEGKENLE